MYSDIDMIDRCIDWKIDMIDKWMHSDINMIDRCIDSWIDMIDR